MSTLRTSEVEPTLTPREVTKIIRTFSESDLKELRLSVGGVELLLSRNDVVDVGRAAPQPEAPTQSSKQSSKSGDLAIQDSGAPDGARSQPNATDDRESGKQPPDDAARQLPPGHVAVRAQAVGVFYRRPSPDEAPYVEVGAAVGVGDPIGIMEVMKMFTTLRAEVSGTVAAIEVADGTLVEYDQVLMVVDTHA